VKLSEFKKHLAQHVEKNVRFVLPDGKNIPAHAHVTEVARIDKKFIDCGGTFRTESHCRLQTWIADDLIHRLSAGKLLAILNKSASFMETEEIDVDVEYEAPVISQFPVTTIETENNALVIHLGIRRTACLAPDKCSPPQTNSYKPIPSFQPAKCC
jgi:hypothetical protein